MAVVVTGRAVSTTEKVAATTEVGVIFIDGKADCDIRQSENGKRFWHNAYWRIGLTGRADDSGHNGLR
jgi:hypothetical protein